MTGAVVGVLVAVGVVIVVLLLVVAVRRRRTPVLGDVSQLGTSNAAPASTAVDAGAAQTDAAAPPGPRIGATALPDAGAIPGVGELLARNDQIGAVKAYRDATGAGLRESSQAVRGWIVAHRGTANVDAVRSLLAEGQTIRAIKLYRQQTGIGLAEAKQAVERIASGTTPAEPAAVPAELVQVQQLVRSGRKIQAIKLYRQLTGTSLVEAKAAVENRRW